MVSVFVVRRGRAVATAWLLSFAVAACGGGADAVDAGSAPESVGGSDGQDATGLSAKWGVIPGLLKSWRTAQTIEIGTDFTGSPKLAVDGYGNAIAVWTQKNGAATSLHFNRYVAGTGWGVPAAMPVGNASFGADVVEVGVDAAGNALAVWSHPVDGGSDLWSSRYTAGGSWTSAVRIASPGGVSVAPQIAVDSAGNAIAVWQQVFGGPSQFYFNRYRAGSGWGQALQLSTDDAQDVYFARAAIDGNGNSIAVWSESNGGQSRLWSRRFAAGVGGKPLARRVEVDGPGDALAPDVAFDGLGNAIAVWTHSNGTAIGLRSGRFVAGTGWSAAQPIVLDAGVTSVERPQIVAEAGGSAVAAWAQRSGGGRKSIASSRYVLAVGWQAPKRADQDDSGDATRVRLAMDSGGVVFAVWQQSDGARTNVWANRFYANGWRTAQRIETDDAGDATRPQIGVSANGYAVALWSQFDGVRQNVVSNDYR